MRIFEKFYRASQGDTVGGVGLGLTICRGIIQAHGGRIWAEHRAGRRCGAPVHASAGRSAACAAAEELDRGGGPLTDGPLVLLIEDEPAMRRFLRAALGTHDFRLVEAGTMREGLAQAAGRNPDVILLDLGLPDGDGLDATRQLREWTSTPIIVLSARGPGAGQDRGPRCRRRRLPHQAVQCG